MGKRNLLSSKQAGMLMLERKGGKRCPSWSLSTLVVLTGSVQGRELGVDRLRGILDWLAEA